MHRRSFLIGAAAAVSFVVRADATERAFGRLYVVGRYDFDGRVLRLDQWHGFRGQVAYDDWLRGEIGWLDSLRPGVPKLGHWRERIGAKAAAGVGSPAIPESDRFRDNNDNTL